MPDPLNSPEVLLTAIETRTARCAVVGLGFIGTTLVEALAQAGFAVDGVDRSPEAVERSRSHLRDQGLAPSPRGSAPTPPCSTGRPSPSLP